MSLLTLNNVSKSFGERVLFENVSFNIENNTKMGFIGTNGVGKTTLFRAILEKEDMKPQSALITGLIANDQNTVKIITVTNTDYDRVEDSILLPLGEYELVDRIEGYTVTVKNEKIRISFSLGSLETMSIYRTK